MVVRKRTPKWGLIVLLPMFGKVDVPQMLECSKASLWQGKMEAPKTLSPLKTDTQGVISSQRLFTSRAIVHKSLFWQEFVIECLRLESRAHEKSDRFLSLFSDWPSTRDAKLRPNSKSIYGFLAVWRLHNMSSISEDTLANSSWSQIHIPSSHCT